MIKKFYTTSVIMPFSNFIDIEVMERNNYPMTDVRQWMFKYNINFDTKVIWVATKKYIAYRYHLAADQWDKITKLKKESRKHSADISVYESPRQGYIISESNDGDDGFLFVLRPNEIFI
jgi:hypothetical protein